MADRPVFHVVAGPNGAGKTTLTRSGRFGGASIIDPDDLARRIDPEDPERATIAAGKEATRMIANNIEVGRDFVQETTLAGVAPIRTAERAIEAGYRVELHFVGINSVRKSHDRVADRVARGGHAIPGEAIERRFDKTFRNAEALAALADRSVFYDNGSPDDPHRVVYERDGRGDRLVPDAPAWAAHVAGRVRDRDARTEPSRETGMAETDVRTAPETTGKDRESADDRAEALHRRSLEAAREGAAQITDPADRARAEAIIGRMEETGRRFREDRAETERDGRPATAPTAQDPNAASRPPAPDAQRQQRDERERVQRAVQQDQDRAATQREADASSARGRAQSRAEREAERDRDDGRE